MENELTVEQFNKDYARNVINADPTSKMTILLREGSEWKVEINGKMTWVKVKISKPVKVMKEKTVMIVDKKYKLPPTAFKMLVYLQEYGEIDSLSNLSRVLELSTKSLYNNLYALEASGMVDKTYGERGAVGLKIRKEI